jgi:hypothetical protein
MLFWKWMPHFGGSASSINGGALGVQAFKYSSINNTPNTRPAAECSRQTIKKVENLMWRCLGFKI